MSVQSDRRRVQLLSRRVAKLQSQLNALLSVIHVSPAGDIELSAASSLTLRSPGAALTLAPQGLTISADARISVTTSGEFSLVAASLVVDASATTLQGAITTAQGTIKCETIIANSVVGSSYTPGAGNIW